MSNLAFFPHLKIDCRSAAESVCGTLSKPSKMPCPAYSIPASACKTGATLVCVKGSVCEGCYALKGRYGFPNVQNAMARRLASLYHPQWIDAIVFLISDCKNKFFRWHDSGDLQSLAHLMNIVRVAERLPDVKFWLPTREKVLVNEYLRAFAAFPPNLVVRVSATMVDGAPSEAFAHTSTVHRAKRARGRRCPAKDQGNACGPCRACWDKGVPNVSYAWH